MYLTEDFLPSLQERTNRNKEYLTLCQKGGFGGGKHLASLSHSLLYKYYWKITTNWSCGLMIKKVHWGIVGKPRKTFSTSGVTFLTVRRLVKDTLIKTEKSVSQRSLSQQARSVWYYRLLRSHKHGFSRCSSRHRSWWCNW